VADGGVQALPDVGAELTTYLESLAGVEPDSLGRSEALAYWVNLYNGHALALAARTQAAGESSVLRDSQEFHGPTATIAGEELSLDDIEHGKVRRLKDPRIHGALVCGSVSCPTLRSKPFDGSAIEDQLEEQMQAFMTAGAVVIDEKNNRISLSRIFYWYGADFVRPHRMPSWLPPRRRHLQSAIEPWLPPEAVQWLASNRPRLAFQRYDFRLACSVA